MLYRTLIEPFLRYHNTTWVNCGSTLLNRLPTLGARVITCMYSYEGTDHDRILKGLNILNVHQFVELYTASLKYRAENALISTHAKNR